MKEFKFCGEITEYVEIPVTIFESQKELVEQISGVIRDAKDLGMGEEESIYVIYKDGSKYFVYDEEEIGKFKRYGIKAAVYEHVNGYEVYGNFAVTGNGDISIEESDIEEYGVYNGQYDVKEESETVVETVETEEKAEKDTIKATYEFTKKADIQACKELARTRKINMTNKWFENVFLTSLFEWVGVGKEKHLTQKQTKVCVDNMKDIVFSYSPNGYDKYFAVRYEYEWCGRTVHMRYSKLNECGYIYFTATEEEAKKNKEKYEEEHRKREIERLTRKSPESLKKMISKKQVKLEKLEAELTELMEMDPDDLEEIEWVLEDIEKIKIEISQLGEMLNAKQAEA